MAAITALVAAITVSLPAVSQLIKQTRRVEDGWHYYFSASEGSPLSLVLAGGGVLGYAMAVLAVLVVFVFVVLATELGQVCCGGSSERAQPESVCSGNVRGQVTILFDSDSAMQR